ncbi:MAG: glycerophosphodiester phosphodiesterase family protein [Pseudomonadota bacterium]
MWPYDKFLGRRKRRPAIVAHRGYGADAPENSLAALDAAMAVGADIVELDIRRASCGTLVVFHDKTLERMAGTAGAVADLPMDELSALPLRKGRGGADAPLTDQTIPSLQMALRHARARCYLDLDVKDPADLQKVAGLVRAVGMADSVDIKTPVSKPADAVALFGVESRFGVMAVPILTLTAAQVSSHVRLVAPQRPELVEVVFDHLETFKEAVRALKRVNAKIFVNTLEGYCGEGLSDEMALKDPAAVWGVLIAAGANVIQTDHPDALADYLVASEREFRTARQKVGAWWKLS